MLCTFLDGPESEMGYCQNSWDNLNGVYRLDVTVLSMLVARPGELGGDDVLNKQTLECVGLMGFHGVSCLCLALRWFRRENMMMNFYTYTHTQGATVVGSHPLGGLGEGGQGGLSLGCGTQKRERGGSGPAGDSSRRSQRMLSLRNGEYLEKLGDKGVTLL